MHSDNDTFYPPTPVATVVQSIEEPRIARDDFEEVGTGAQIVALYGALAAASGAFKPFEKNRHVKIEKRGGGSYEYDYAELGVLIEATRPALSAHGLFIGQPFTRVASQRTTEKYVDDQGVVREDEVWLARVVTIIAHKDGGRLLFTTEFFASNDIKNHGGQITYMRRYQYQAATGIDAGEVDADQMPTRQGEGAATVTPKRQREAPTPQRQEAKPQQKPPSRPQEEQKSAPVPTPQAKSEPPPAPKPEPSNAELARGLGMPVDVVDVGHQSMVPKTEPRTEVDTDASDFDPRKLSAQELEDAIKVNGRAIGITKAGIAMLYQEVSKNQETTMMNASRTHHEAALLVLMRRRREAEASQSL